MTKSSITLIGSIYASVLFLSVFTVGLLGSTNDISTFWKHILTAFLLIAIMVPLVVYFWDEIAKIKNQAAYQRETNKTTVLEFSDW